MRLKLQTFLRQHFADRGWQWSLKDRGKVQPTEADFVAALDQAARVLYSETSGTILEVGRLVIIKQDEGLDVYVLAGTYKGEE